MPMTTLAKPEPLLSKELSSLLQLLYLITRYYIPPFSLQLLVTIVGFFEPVFPQLRVRT
jgi:hypothetical protein